MLSIICGCCKTGQKKLGTEMAPKVILNELQNNHKECSGKFKTYHIKHDDFHDMGYKGLYDLSKVLTEPILTLGGDHSIGLATVMASAHKYKDNLKIIWFDAHADINTPETSPSGNIHGMPLAPVFKLMKPWFSLDKDYFLKPEQLIYIGLRSVDSGELDIIKELGIKTYYNTDVFSLGIDKIMNDIMKDDTKDTKYHLSFDIDGLDPQYSPSTGTKEKDGVSLKDGLYIINELVNSKKLRSFDLVEFNPELGTEKDKKVTLNTCIELIKPFIYKH